MTQKFNVRRTSRPQIYVETATRLAAMIARPRHITWVQNRSLFNMHSFGKQRKSQGPVFFGN